MSLVDEYRQQFAWRAWSRAFDALPSLRDQLILDLGCGIGDQAAELAARGARVLGFDANDELLREARSRSIPRVEFRHADLSSLSELGSLADGIWCSFTAAYFPELPVALASWSKHLRAGGWIALTEVDDLFGHQPLSEETKSVFDAYAREALRAKRYDFFMGHKLRNYLEHCGFEVGTELTLPDAELSFDGPASPTVIDAWAKRLDRLRLLRDRAGPNYELVRAEFLACLASTGHRSAAKVYCCIGVR